jgi:translation initiation factor 3 subunit L
MENDSDDEGMEYVQESAYEQDNENNFGDMPSQDLTAQLQQAAQPLEYGATTETKIQSYDQYCNLFHFILNSDGPVDIDVPSVSIYDICGYRDSSDIGYSTTGRGT